MARSSRPLRSSFVHTIAAAAVAAVAGSGCGGQVSSPATDQGDARDPEGGPGPGCPATAPAYDSACEGVLTCRYDWCPYNGGYWKDDTRCLDGKWSTISTSCNPPPPPSHCPPDEPNPGESCSVFAYGCLYADTCSYGSSTLESASCTAGRWEITSAAYAVSCPKTAPTNGSSCRCGTHLAPSICKYADSCGPDNTLAACDAVTGTWRVGISTCNPPMPDAGYDTEPTDAGAADAGSPD